MVYPVMRSNWRRSRAVIYSPLRDMGSLIYNDSKADFDFFTFSYENSEVNIKNINIVEHFKFKSEFWGETFLKLCNLIKNRYDVVLFMNSDLYVSVSSLNKFFDINDLFMLDFSQPSLSANSYYSHIHTINIPSGGVVEVPFIEIMMPCLSSRVINEICSIGITTISGWGIDNSLFPYIRDKLKLKNPAVIHDCTVIHVKPVESSRQYSDGLTVEEQMKKLKEYLILNSP